MVSCLKGGKSAFFSTVNAAQKYLEQNLVDMVFMDISSNHYDWTELVGLVRLIDNAIKIVLISDNSHEAVKAFEIGAFDFLMKPVTYECMSRIILKSHHYMEALDNGD